MWGYHHDITALAWWFMTAGMVLFWAAVAWVILTLSRSSRRSAEDILAERFARGRSARRTTAVSVTWCGNRRAEWFVCAPTRAQVPKGGLRSARPIRVARPCRPRVPAQMMGPTNRRLLREHDPVPRLPARPPRDAHVR